MPRASYFKGDGASVWRDLVRRYGRKRASSLFYAIASKHGLTPGNPKNKR